MLEVRTHIDIAASASLVWGILIDFNAYRRWNPFIRAIQGQALTGDCIEITQDFSAFGPSTYRSTLTHLREPRELRWNGRWAIPGLYSTEHRFGIESLPAGKVRFHQSEQYSGLAVLFVRGRLQQLIEPAFGAMNEALKRRAERAEGPKSPTTLDTRQYADQDKRS